MHPDDSGVEWIESTIMLWRAMSRACSQTGGGLIELEREFLATQSRQQCKQ